ncbi:MAG: hypothetical protein E7032_01635 [Akkermansiaceae bacterium]|nr:hypothetical protein [Akkermansiaceae bacterium]
MNRTFITLSVSLLLLSNICCAAHAAESTVNLQSSPVSTAASEKESSFVEALFKAMCPTQGEREAKLSQFCAQYAEKSKLANQAFLRLLAKKDSEITPDDIPAGMPGTARFLAETAIQGRVAEPEARKMLLECWKIWCQELEHAEKRFFNHLVPELDFSGSRNSETSAGAIAWMNRPEALRYCALSLVQQEQEVSFEVYGLVNEYNLEEYSLSRLLMTFHRLEKYQLFLGLLTKELSAVKGAVQLQGAVAPFPVEIKLQLPSAEEGFVKAMQKNVLKAYTFDDEGELLETGQHASSGEVRKLFQTKLESAMQKMLLAYQKQLHFRRVYLNCLNELDAAAREEDFKKYDEMLRHLYQNDIQHLIKRSDWIADGSCWDAPLEADMLPGMVLKLMNRSYRNTYDGAMVLNEGEYALSEYRKAMRSVCDTYVRRQLELDSEDASELLAVYVSRCAQEAEYAWECYMEELSALLMPPLRGYWGSGTGRVCYLTKLHFVSNYEKFYEYVLGAGDEPEE